MELVLTTRKRKHYLTDAQKHVICEAAWAELEKGADAKAVSMLLPLAEKGYAEAQTALGVIYRTGEGLQDPVKALYFLQKAAEQNDPLAFAHLGRMYQDGYGVEKDEKRALAYYEQGAAMWDDVCLLALGCLYAQGIGVEANSLRAVGHLLLSKEKGNFEAGQVLDASLQDAAFDALLTKQMIPYHEQLAKAGDVMAMSVLCICYRDGFWTKQDQEKAKLWAVQGAKAGSDACRDLLTQL